ncbi:UNKNOWN [Stylonychia lemnae]|uniref:Protein kinase domain-containing protein n=1 Tax=Stylonychia lemnae TaxID=5949 RepID=A0A077ZZG2_STYLE|nr:UNKNOWN [Stylonychia lemnae]|eukprot:CDW73893.1 UNKNOWN [Stylonychia lemnae]
MDQSLLEEWIKLNRSSVFIEEWWNLNEEPMLKFIERIKNEQQPIVISNKTQFEQRESSLFELVKNFITQNKEASLIDSQLSKYFYIALKQLQFHQQQMIYHGDINPMNIMISENSLDFKNYQSSFIIDDAQMYQLKSMNEIYSNEEIIQTFKNNTYVDKEKLFEMDKSSLIRIFEIIESIFQKQGIQLIIIQEIIEVLNEENRYFNVIDYIGNFVLSNNLIFTAYQKNAQITQEVLQKLVKVDEFEEEKNSLQNRNFTYKVKVLNFKTKMIQETFLISSNTPLKQQQISNLSLKLSKVDNSIKSLQILTGNETNISRLIIAFDEDEFITKINFDIENLTIHTNRKAFVIVEGKIVKKLKFLEDESKKPLCQVFTFELNECFYLCTVQKYKQQNKNIKQRQEPQKRRKI